MNKIELQQIGDAFIDQEVGSDLGSFESKWDGEYLHFYFKTPGYPDETSQCVIDAVRMLNRHNLQYKPDYVGGTEIILKRCKESENAEFFRRDEFGDYIDPEF